jgi:hypothetical protein
MGTHLFRELCILSVSYIINDSVETKIKREEAQEQRRPISEGSPIPE